MPPDWFSHEKVAGNQHFVHVFREGSFSFQRFCTFAFSIKYRWHFFSLLPNSHYVSKDILRNKRRLFLQWLPNPEWSAPPSCLTLRGWCKCVPYVLQLKTLVSLYAFVVQPTGLCFHLFAMIQTCIYLYSSTRTLHNGVSNKSIYRFLIGLRGISTNPAFLKCAETKGKLKSLLWDTVRKKIDFLLRICWAIPCLPPLCRIRT